MENKQRLTILKDLRLQFRLTSFDRSLAASEKLLRSEAKLKIGVLGRFKSGKSSFINSILGIDILPTGVLPVTGIITSITAGEAPRAFLELKDGSKKEIPIISVGDYISEAKNPQNRMNVSEVIIEHPKLKKYAGLTFVDTPGLGSTHVHNSEVATDWIPEVGAALVAIAADPPISENDLSLIRRLSQDTPNIAILITKIDTVETASYFELERFTHDELKKNLNRDFQVYPYSIKIPYTAQKVDFEFLNPLVESAKTEVESVLRHKLASMKTEMKSFLDVALVSARKSESERQSLRTKIASEREKFESFKREVVLRLSVITREIRPALTEHYRKVEERVSSRLENEFDQTAKLWKVNLLAFSRKYEDWLDRRLNEELGAQLVKDEARVHGLLAKGRDAFTDVVSNFHLRLEESVKKNLEVELKPPKFKMDIVVPTRPNLAFIHGFSIHVDLLWFMIPMKIFGKLFKRHFLKSIPGEVFKNCSRVVRQWSDAIELELNNMSAETVRLIEDEIETLEGLLLQRLSNVPAIESALSRLEGGF